MACLWGIAPAAAGEAPSTASDAFFAGLDALDAGDQRTAIAHLVNALSLEPEMHQARLYLAECFHATGQDEQAVTQLRSYIAADFPGAELERARALLLEWGGELDPDTDMDTDTVHLDDLDPEIASTPPRSRPWSVVRLETGLHVSHYANELALVAAGPLLGLRVRPLPFLEIGAYGRMEWAAHPDAPGTIHVPGFGLSAHAALEIRRVSLLVGVVVPGVISRVEGSVGLDAGLLGALGLRVPIGDSRLVMGAEVSAGYVVRPTVGGSLCLGVQLGRRARP